MNSGLPPTPSAVVAVSVAPQLAPMGGPGVKLKFCRYYAKDKTCFYGDECQFLHEEPLGIHGNCLAGYPQPVLPGPVTPAGKKVELGGPDGQRLTIPGIDGGALPDSSLTDSYFSTSFIGMNGFGSPAEGSYPRIQRMTNSSSSPSLLNDSAKPYTGHGMSLSAGSSPLHSPKITPHTSPSPRRRSHTPNPATYMVPTSASTPVTNSVSQPPSAGQVIQKETVGGTTYFYTDTTPAPPTGMVFPNYHIYPPTAPHVAYMHPKANAPSFFMADELRQELINRHLITMAQIDQADIPSVPAEVDSYHSLFPLEPLPTPNRIHKSSNFGYITSCYKAVNSKDDLTYCLRRVHGFRLVNTKCMSLVDTWKKIQHSNIVTLREMFTTKAFGEHSLVFAYDFHAGAETMMSRHFNDPSADAYFTKRKWGQHDGPLPRQHAGLLPESLIWAYIVQLSSALRTIHTGGLACRVMDPTKILITGKTRLHVNCAGIFDVLTYDGSQSNPVTLMPQYQQADLISLGKVVLALSCNSLAGIQRENLQKAMELVNINYSSDLKNLILYLLTDQNRLRSVNDIMPMIGARFYTQLDAAQMRNDVIEEDLAKEVQNGRLFRLLAKLGTINERPEFQKDPAWSETGDRYLLKLFRDHLFHQVTEAGTPWIDLSHIVSCLNKLDAGVPEKISLISRDEKSVLVVTYSDLKRCFENTFQELVAAANGQL
ncbi:PAN2-PAN3 deadenylation complex subunit PAN3 isoform X2 [Rhinoderma darwinii]|uniref:PAN2-PAN3 deadenylation complex subunit PAN3 isoform X2 n=1 Tax=Rhinoderma darwinii TaxID=43563 RepID=UPI003F661A0B